MTRLLTLLSVLFASNAALLANIVPYYPHQAVLVYVLSNDSLVTLIRKDSRLSKADLSSAAISHTGELYDSKYEVELNYASQIDGVDFNCALKANTAMDVKYAAPKNGAPQPVGLNGLTKPIFSEVNCTEKQ